MLCSNIGHSIKQFVYICPKTLLAAMENIAEIGDTCFQEKAGIAFFLHINWVKKASLGCPYLGSEVRQVPVRSFLVLLIAIRGV